MKHYGDIQKIDGHKVPLVDIITAGSPCQDLSIAGKRAGLSGERSGLFMESIRIIKEMHDESRRTNQPVRPRFLVFENVTGVLSSNDGEDFRTILEEVIHIVDPDSDVPRLAEGQSWSGVGCVLGDGWSLAWKVHDSQFWGVPQRRRRLCLVADFRGESAPEILFERKSLSRDLEQGGEEGKGTPEAVERSSDSANYTLKIRGGVETDSSGRSAGKGALIQKEVSACLNAVQDQTLFQDVPTVYGISPLESNSMKSSNPHSGIYEADTARTLDENGGNPNCNQGGMLVIENHPADSRCKVKDDGIVQTLNGRMGTGGGNVPLVMSYRGDNITSPTNQSNPQAGDPCHTLVNDDRNYVVLTEDHFGDYNESDTAASLRKSGGTLGGGKDMNRKTVVRRLTPLECERLQGFPDGWTDIGTWTDTQGKKHKPSDAPRYKALGNSLAVGYANNRKGFWCWLADRMVEQLKADGVEDPTMASLFDGIGGFPLAYQSAGCKPIWASEIEEFPIAVTKIHFPEEEERKN